MSRPITIITDPSSIDERISNSENFFELHLYVAKISSGTPYSLKRLNLAKDNLRIAVELRARRIKERYCA